MLRNKAWPGYTSTLIAVALTILSCAAAGMAQNPTGRPDPRKPKKPANKPTPVTVTLTIITDPPESHVFVNGEERGTTDSEGKLQLAKLALGHYDIEARKDGYSNATRGFEAGPEPPTVVLKLTATLEGDVKEFDSLVAAGKLTGPDAPNALDLVNKLSALHPDRSEVVGMRSSLYEKLMERANASAASTGSNWKGIARDDLVRGHDASTAALTLKAGDKRAGSREAYLAGVLALYDWETGSRAGPEDGGSKPDSGGHTDGSPAGLAQARANLDRAVEQEESWALAQYQLGTVMLLAGDAASAETHFIKSVELEPHWAVGHAGLGAAYYANKKYKESVAEYQKAVETDPKSASAYAGLGLARSAKGDTNAGIKDIQRAVELDPNSGLPHLNLGIIYAQSKKAKEASHAEEELKLAIQKNQQNLEFQNSVAEKLISDLQKKKKK
jgi:tetratricopeptide (TPR) repeat protein